MKPEAGKSPPFRERKNRRWRRAYFLSCVLWDTGHFQASGFNPWQFACHKLEEQTAIASVPTTQPPPPAPGRAADIQTALRLTYITLVWMTVEGGAALWLGRASHSLLLESFGLDSVVEMGSASVLLWRLRVEAGGRADAARVGRAERRAAVVAGCLLYGLAAWVVWNSLSALLVIHTETNTHESVWGIAIGLVAKIGMPILAGYKLKVAARLGSKALRADAMEAVTCGTLSVVLMVGLAVTRIFPSLGWLDSVAALALVPFLIKEGREAVTGKCSCGSEENSSEL